MKRGLTLVILVGVLLLSITGMVLAKGRVAIIFATGGLGDKSFNDSAYEGMLLAKEKFGIEFDQAEPTAIAEYETFLTQFANTRRYDLIISIGFDQADALSKVADRFPNQKFAIVDMVVDKPNVASYVYKEKERGFLLGVAAALMTTRADDPRVNPEKIVGVIGGMKIPLIDANIAGFIAGAKYIDPEVKVLYSYVGSWADPAKGKELALSMFEQGADIIWGAAGRSGLGVIKAAEEQNRFVIGADSDQGYLAPNNVLTNGMKFVNNTVLIAIKQVLDNEFQPGIHLLGVKENALGYTKNLLPDDIIKKLEEVKIKMINGEIEIPDKIEDIE
ncbi:BMP family lipoprotein [Anoxybacter fermentans]|nr:BMP family ABC transporter substrate-binding protein [Anoxybacter fermentans]